MTLPVHGRDRRETAGSIATSALVHVVLIALLWFGQAHVRDLAADLGVGTGIGPGLAGGGGGGSTGDEDLTYIELPAPEPAAAPVKELIAEIPEVPLPELPADLAAEVAPLDTQRLALLASAASGSGTGSGTGTGEGQGPGSGPGSGGGSGGGDGGGIGSGVGSGIGRGNVLAPWPLLILVPPSAPRAVKGRTISVRLEVDSAGVVRNAELDQPTGDRSYDEKLRKAALGWRFHPARDAANRAVAAAFNIEVSF